MKNERIEENREKPLSHFAHTTFYPGREGYTMTVKLPHYMKKEVTNRNGFCIFFSDCSVLFMPEISVLFRAH